MYLSLTDLPLGSDGAGALGETYVRTAFVSSAGDDGTAELNDIDLPFATLAAAFAELNAEHGGETVTIRLLTDITEDAEFPPSERLSGLTIKGHGAVRTITGTISTAGEDGEQGNPGTDGGAAGSMTLDAVVGAIDARGGTGGNGDGGTEAKEVTSFDFGALSESDFNVGSGTAKYVLISDAPNRYCLWFDNTLNGDNPVEPSALDGVNAYEGFAIPLGADDEAIAAAFLTFLEGLGFVDSSSSGTLVTVEDAINGGRDDADDGTSPVVVTVDAQGSDAVSADGGNAGASGNITLLNRAMTSTFDGSAQDGGEGDNGGADGDDGARGYLLNSLGHVILTTEDGLPLTDENGIYLTTGAPPP